MATSVFMRTLDAGSLSALLAFRRPGVLPYAIVERVDALSLPPSNTPLDPAMWPIGCAFGPDLEVRWQVEGSALSVWWSGAAPGDGWQLVLDLAQAHASQRRTYLWGHDNVAFASPLVLGAVAGERGRPQLLAVEYRDPADGRLLWLRYAGIEREDS